MIARAARADDCAGVVACALAHHAYLPGREQVEGFFDEACACGGMFVAEHDDAIIGFLCALEGPHPFTGRPCISVVAWWVPHRHRATGAGLALVRVFLKWCSTQRVDLITISAPISSSLGAFLQARGFTAAETLWTKGVP